MKKYLELLQYILDEGVDKGDRTGTGTRSVFGYQLRFNLQDGFPLLTTKKMHYKSIFHELLWFISGSSNIKYLKDNGVKIWNEWADDNGDIGHGSYGPMWRNFNGVDQISDVIKEIKNNPNSRRMIVSAWNPAEIQNCALPPCHCLFQFNVSNNKLSCQLYQRSCDVFLGVPFNIASYALLTHMVAHVCNLEVGTFVHTFGDVHIYNNHFDQVKKQIDRDPYTLPTLNLNSDIKDIYDFKYEDIKLDNYLYHPSIKAKVSV